MKNIHPIFDRIISRAEKEQFLNQNARVIWLTGLSGSGKSTIAEGVEKLLFGQGFFVQLLDGDNTRTGINNNLGFSIEDRNENIRRIAELSKLFIQSGVICLNSFVSPTLEIRALAKKIIGPADFIEVFVDTSVEVCEQRDVKGLYKKARAGEIKSFTGIDSPFEKPERPDLRIDTTKQTVEESIYELYNFVLPIISPD